MEDVGTGTSALFQSIEQLGEKCGLAGAGLSGENHKALAGFNANKKLSQSGFMRARAAIETSIRGDMEGAFSHAKEVEKVVVRHVLGQTTPMGRGTERWNGMKTKREGQLKESMASN